MHGNRLIFSRSGDRRKLYPVSPYLFPQYSALNLNQRFLPEENELPKHGLTTQLLTFDFGFSVAALQVGPLDSQYAPIVLGGNFLAIAITGVSDVPPSQNVVPGAALPANTTFPTGVQVDPAYLVLFQQTHEGNTWNWTNKAVTNREACGTAKDPLLFKRPVLIPAGDTLTCTVQNLANTSLRVQITLLGGTF
jgi:hypothetical protein